MVTPPFQDGQLTTGRRAHLLPGRHGPLRRRGCGCPTLASRHAPRSAAPSRESSLTIRRSPRCRTLVSSSSRRRFSEARPEAVASMKSSMRKSSFRAYSRMARRWLRTSCYGVHVAATTGRAAGRGDASRPARRRRPLVFGAGAEAEARRQRRITRLRRASRLPSGKTFATLDTRRLSGPVVRQLETLATGAFLETATNVLAFGPAGRGQEPRARGSPHKSTRRSWPCRFGASGCNSWLYEAPFCVDRASGHLNAPDGDLGVGAINRHLCR